MLVAVDGVGDAVGDDVILDAVGALDGEGGRQLLLEPSKHSVGKAINGMSS